MTTLKGKMVVSVFRFLLLVFSPVVRLFESARPVGEPESLLMVSTTGIGNSLLLSGVVKRLKAEKPNLSIGILTIRSNVQVYERMKEFDKVFLTDGTVRGYLRLITRLRRASFDAAFLMYPEAKLKYAVILFLSGIPIRVSHCYDRFKEEKFFFLFTNLVDNRSGTHETKKDWDMMRSVLKSVPALAVEAIMPWFSVTADETEVALVKAKTYGLEASKKAIGIHPGSSKQYKGKRWPIEYYIALIEELKTRFSDVQILIFGGLDDEDISASLWDSSCTKGIVNLIGKLSFVESACLISRCSYFISNDSGLMHLASAFGVALLAIFGPSDEMRSGPVGDNAKILRSSVDCSGCRLSDTEVSCIKDFLCIREIKPDVVVRAVEDSLPQFLC